MWYTFIRVLIGLILCIITIIWMKKYKLIKKKVIVIVTVLIFMIVTTLSYFAPVENLFVSFSSPQEVFQYSTIGTILDVVEGNDSAMIMYKNSAISQTFIPRNEKGWKIGTSISQEQVVSTLVSPYYICIYHVKNTNDFYVIVDEAYAEKKRQVEDNKNSYFQCIENKTLNSYHYKYYSYVENIDSSYRIRINGEDIAIIKS